MDELSGVAGWLGNLGLWVLSVMVLVGAFPMVITVVQFVLLGVDQWRDHYRDDQVDLDHLPRVVVLVPAWNEAPVLRVSVDMMMSLDYPPDRLRLAIVDDASTDETPELLAAKQLAYPGRVLNLRRQQGGQGKAHTLNHGLREILADDWAEAILITDADVVFAPTAVRRLVRHLGDPSVGAVTAFISEASEPPNWLNRYIAFEYVMAQAAGRRAQNVVGVQGCLAGGAQLLTRANLVELGSRIDTTTLAEDTVTTFLTQINGRRVIFDGNAVCYAEEPREVSGLWKQRIRWSRGNVQVARKFPGIFLVPTRAHRLWNPLFSMMWWSTLLLPVFMVASSAALVTLWFADNQRALNDFTLLWITNALGFIFTTIYGLLIEPRVASRTWLQAITFPGLVSLTVMAWVLVPRPMHALVHDAAVGSGAGWSQETRHYLALAAYLWVGLCMVAAWAVYRISRVLRVGWLIGIMVILVGYGPLLCTITFAAYIAELRNKSITWEKTEKTGKVAAR